MNWTFALVALAFGTSTQAAQGSLEGVAPIQSAAVVQRIQALFLQNFLLESRRFDGKFMAEVVGPHTSVDTEKPNPGRFIRRDFTSKDSASCIEGGSFGWTDLQGFTTKAGVIYLTLAGAKKPGCVLTVEEAMRAFGRPSSVHSFWPKDGSPPLHGPLPPDAKTHSMGHSTVTYALKTGEIDRELGFWIDGAGLVRQVKVFVQNPKSR